MKKYILPILLLLLIFTSGTAFYFYKKVVQLKVSSEVVAKKETEDLVVTVGKLIILPVGEVPTVATVADLDKLKDQPFFAKAKVGDKVLLYANAKKAYLYNPTNNKVIEVAPIALEPEPIADSTPVEESVPADETSEVIEE